MSLILHNYPNSPFAEKIRLMLGYTGLEWQSCFTPEAPPRPELMTLTGGYNRVPVAQLGADIFCDSNLIAREVAALAKQPELSPETLTAEQKERQAFFESKLFFACVITGFSKRLLLRIALRRGIFKTIALIKDRVAMGKNAAVPMGSPKTAPVIIRKVIGELTSELNAKPFLAGDKPNLLDFALYHDFWFIKEVGRKSLGENTEVVDAWYTRMQAFSKNATSELNVQQAVTVAKNAEPRAIDDALKQDPNIGKQVTISTTDYRRAPIAGVLVGADDYSWILQREVEPGNLVNVHFPQSGYELVVA